MGPFRQLLFVLGLLGTVAGPPPATGSDAVPVRHFTASDGLPRTSIRALAQTNDGRLWIGTRTGVTVYDGHTFRSVALPDSVGVRAVVAIHAMPDNTVWVAPFQGGAVQLNAHGVVRSVLPTGLGSTVRQFVHRRDTLHFVTSEAVWTLPVGANRPARRALQYDIRPPAQVAAHPHSGTGVIDAATAPDGPLWILDGHRGPGRVQPDGTVTFFDVPHARPGPPWSQMAFAAPGSLLLTRKGTVYRFDVQTHTLETIRSGIAPPLALNRTSNGLLGVWNGRVFRSAGQSVSPLLSLPPDHQALAPTVVLRDQEGGIWIGTRTGLLQLPDPQIRHVGSVAGTSLSHVGRFLDAGTALWARTWGSGLVQLRPRRTVRTPDGVSYWSSAVGLDGRAHAISGDAWYRWTRARGWHAVRAAPHAVRGVVGPDGVGYLWHDDGLYRYDPSSSAAPVPLASWPPDDRATHMVTMTPDTGLVVRDDALLLHLRPTDGYPLDTLARLPPHLASAEAKHMTADGPGRLWMAFYRQGLVRVDPDGAPVVRHLLQGVPIETARVVGDSLVLASSKTGLYLVDAATGHVRRHLTETEGLYSTAVSAAHLTADTLYVGHARGLTLIPTPALFAPISSPSTVLTSLELHHTTRAPIGDSVFDARARSVGFSYAGTTLARPAHVRYEYRLSPRDTAWRSTTQSFTRYVNLDPGRYRFEVRSRLGTQPPGAPATYAFVIPPRFYETWWFWGLCSLGLVGLLVAGVRWREAHLRRRQRTLETAVRERTEALASEKEKTEAQAQRLVELDETKNRFFANVSHEFRTPLSLILQPIRDVLRETSSSPVSLPRHRLQMMRDNARRLQALIDQLLDLATLQAGSTALEPRHGDVGAFVERVTDSFASLAGAQGIEMEIDRPEAPLETVFDPDKLEKVLMNLLSNALKFTPEGGRVTVTVDRVEEEIVLRVRDTGVGIPTEAQATIFDRFHQTDDASTREHEGTGLGLAVAREFVELHDGRIDVNSTPNEGSTFTVRLPLRQNPDVPPLHPEPIRPVPVADESGDAAPDPRPAVADPDGEQIADSASEGPAILVVEDNAAMRRYVHETLSTEYAILEAEDGRRGWDRVQEDRPDLVLCDVMMPAMDGYELCRRIKRHDELRALPVILLTARAATGDAVEGLKCGADDVVTKPFDARELRQRIDNHLTVRDLLRERYERHVRLDGTEARVSEDDVPFLKQVMVAIENHLDDPDFTVARLSEAVALSRRHLSRRLKAAVGETASEFIRRYRIERAAELLDDDPETIAEVAYAVGFRSPSHFTQVFREHVGCTPSEYVKGNA